MRIAPTELSSEFESDLRTYPDEFEMPRSSTPRAQGTRAAIMAAARESFVKNGIGGTRLAAVARACWVAPSTVSLHFKGKEALFVACLDEEVEVIFERSAAALAGHPYPQLSGDFTRVMTALLPQFPLLSTVLVRSPARWGHRFYDSYLMEQSRTALGEEIARTQAAGLVRSDISAEALGFSLGHLMTCAMWPMLLGGVEDDQVSESAYAVMVASLFHPVDRVLDFLAVVEPWRAAHPDLPVNFGDSALSSLALLGRDLQAHSA
jgi:AcrR family transcriptional regulator